MATRAGAVALLLLLAQSASAQQPAAAEHEVKAAYLYNFARFVAWPPRTAARAQEPFAICVLGTDPFGRSLEMIVDGVTIEGARVVVRHMTSARDATACRILFISGSEERGLDGILAALARADVLTVSDMPRFVERGGMIQFVIDKGRVRFEVGLPPAQDAGLMLRSELLRVASAVRRERRPGA
jgi:hypothetical protein